MARSIGPYTILEALGSGARGEVFLAEDTRLGRRVAIAQEATRAARDVAQGVYIMPPFNKVDLAVRVIEALH